VNSEKFEVLLGRHQLTERRRFFRNICNTKFMKCSEISEGEEIFLQLLRQCIFVCRLPVSCSSLPSYFHLLFSPANQVRQASTILAQSMQAWTRQFDVNAGLSCMVCPARISRQCSTQPSLPCEADLACALPGLTCHTREYVPKLFPAWAAILLLVLPEASPFRVIFPK
jgi:hypothetical protein